MTSHGRTLEHVLVDVANSAVFDVQNTTALPRTIQAWHNSMAANERILARHAQPVVPDSLQSELVACLESILGQFIVDGEVGNGFARALGGWLTIDTSSLARDSMKAVAILGPEKVAQLLRGWAAGEGIAYRHHMVLSGATVDEPFSIDGGVHVDRLPDTSTALSYRLPEFTRMHFGQMSWTNAALVSIDCEAWPAFGRPDEMLPGRASAIGGIWLETPNRFGHALSLKADHAISCAVAWSESEEADAFGQIHGGGSFILGDMHPPNVCLSRSVVEAAVDLSRRQFNDWTMDRNVGLAIERWARSKSHHSLTDQLIDLRIALEALFLKDANQELSFRLALRAAWFMGATFDERQRIADTLRDIYSLASKAIHAGEIDFKERSQELTAVGQSLCRAAILKRLNEGEEPNWDEVILDQ